MSYGFGAIRRRRAGTGNAGGGTSPLRAIANALAPTAYVGAVWDFADKNAAWQDTAGTTAVTSDGQWVARADDLTGRGRHLLQGAMPSRPQYTALPNGKPALLFDGADDWLTLDSFNLTGTDRLVVIAGQRKLGDPPTIRTLVELSADSSSNSGAFIVLSPTSGATGYYFSRYRGDGTARAITATDAAYAAPHSAVLTASYDIGGRSGALRVNGVDAGTITLTAGAGNFGDYPLFVGRKAGTSFPYLGYLSSLIIMDPRALDVIPGGLSAVEAAVNAGLGAY